jgi:hypothetical protein
MLQPFFVRHKPARPEDHPGGRFASAMVRTA